MPTTVATPPRINKIPMTEPAMTPTFRLVLSAEVKEMVGKRRMT
jgi:hypothetical protein